MIYAAFLSVEHAESIELKTKPISRRSRFIHRTAVITAITSSVGFLESSINEFYFLVSQNKGRKIELSEESKAKISAVWSIEKFRATARILEKYQTALQLVGVPDFEEGAKIYQNAKLVIDLRNAFVHYYPELRTIKLHEEDEGLLRLEKALRGKFKKNSFIGKFPVIHTRQPEERADYPLFPENCFSASCAHWAANSVLEFGKTFFSKISCRPYFDHFLEILPGTKTGIEEREDEEGVGPS